MRFAITAVDRYLGVFESFVGAGWQPVRLFTAPLANGLDSHQAVTRYAKRHNAPIQFGRMCEEDLRQLRDEGCDALIVASYDWRIGDWQPYLKYAVNFHSAPLPEARGPYPINRAILENRASWGVTCHRVSESFDAGDIVAVESFPLQVDECHERLDIKVQMAAKRLSARVAQNFVSLWQNAIPQADGSYWRLPSLQDRSIDFHMPVDQIMRQIRAFGATGTLAKLHERLFVVTRALGWTENHGKVPGTIAHVHNRTFVVAAADGYIAVVSGVLASPEFAQSFTEGRRTCP